MGELPKNFPATTPQAIASYQWTDIDSGVGYVSFYAAETDDGYLILTDIPFKASERKGGVKIEGETDVTRTYEGSPFNTPRIISGTMNIYYNMWCNTAATPATVTFKVYKNAVQLATGTVYNAGDASTEYRFMGTLDIPRTKFKIGDVLKIVFNITGTITTLYLMQNPAGEGRTYQVKIFEDSCLKFDVPFEVRV